MTSRERIEAALNHREPDRTPIYEYVLLSPIADIILGHKYIDYGGDWEDWICMALDTGWERALRQYASDRLTLAERLGHDMLYVVPNPLPEDVSGNSETDIAGCLSEDPAERMRSRNDEDRQQAGKFKEDRLLVYYYLFDEMKKRGLDLPINAPAYAHGIWTDVDLMQTMLLEPEVAHEHFELATAKVMPGIEKFLGIGVKQIGIGGDFSGNRLLISPENYRSFIVPQLRIISDRIHEAGGWAINGSDGDLWPVIDDFLIGSGADGYIEVDMRAGMDLKKLKEAYGRKITFYGNMDCGEVLSFCSHKEIRDYTVKCLDDGRGSGGHIFTASNAVTGSVPIGNYMAMVNTYRDVFGLPVLHF